MELLTSISRSLQFSPLDSEVLNEFELEHTESFATNQSGSRPLCKAGALALADPKRFVVYLKMYWSISSQVINPKITAGTVIRFT